MELPRQPSLPAIVVGNDISDSDAGYFTLPRTPQDQTIRIRRSVLGEGFVRKCFVSLEMLVEALRSAVLELVHEVEIMQLLEPALRIDLRSPSSDLRLTKVAELAHLLSDPRRVLLQAWVLIFFDKRDWLRHCFIGSPSEPGLRVPRITSPKIAHDVFVRWRQVKANSGRFGARRLARRLPSSVTSTPSRGYMADSESGLSPRLFPSDSSIATSRHIKAQDEARSMRSPTKVAPDVTGPGLFRPGCGKRAMMPGVRDRRPADSFQPRPAGVSKLQQQAWTTAPSQGYPSRVAVSTPLNPASPDTPDHQSSSIFSEWLIPSPASDASSDVPSPRLALNITGEPIFLRPNGPSIHDGDSLDRGASDTTLVLGQGEHPAQSASDQSASLTEAPSISHRSAHSVSSSSGSPTQSLSLGDTSSSSQNRADETFADDSSGPDLPKTSPIAEDSQKHPEPIVSCLSATHRTRLAQLVQAVQNRIYIYDDLRNSPHHLAKRLRQVDMLRRNLLEGTTTTLSAEHRRTFLDLAHSIQPLVDRHWDDNLLWDAPSTMIGDLVLLWEIINDSLQCASAKP